MQFTLPQPKVILTHESDLDGFVSGLLLQRLAGHLFHVEVPVEAYNYQNWRTRPLPENSAWVCDFSFEGRLDKPEWVIIDHHPYDKSPQKAMLFHDPQKSASQLCYELCQKHGVASSELDTLVHYSNVADLFLESDNDFTVANDYANLVKTYQFWNLYELIDGKLENLIQHPLLEVMVVKRRVEDPLGLAWSRKCITPITDTVGVVHTVIGNVNLIVHQLLDDPGIPFQVLITLFRKNNGTIIASLRSRNGEASKIAERLQGGGHPNASGATLPRGVQRIPDAIEYLKKVLNPPSPNTGPNLNSLEGLFAAAENDLR